MGQHDVSGHALQRQPGAPYHWRSLPGCPLNQGYLLHLSLEVLFAGGGVDSRGVHPLVAQELRDAVQRYSDVDQVLPKRVPERMRGYVFKPGVVSERFTR